MPDSADNNPESSFRSKRSFYLFWNDGIDLLQSFTARCYFHWTWLNLPTSVISVDCSGFQEWPSHVTTKRKSKKNVYWICSNSVWLFIHCLINTLKMQCTHVIKSLLKEIYHNQLTYHNIPPSPQCHMTENWLIITYLYNNDFLVYASTDSLVSDQNAKIFNADKKTNRIYCSPHPCLES